MATQLDEPVENTGQPLLAGALRESLEISAKVRLRKNPLKLSFLRDLCALCGSFSITPNIAQVPTTASE